MTPQPHSPPSPTLRPRYRAVIIAGLLVAAVALVFGQTLRHEMINYDDDRYIYENPHVLDGLTLHGTVWALTKTYANNWHPLAWLSHMLDCQMFGRWYGGHHLTSVLLHAATAVALALVLARMTGRVWPAAFAAALFAIHPLRVESVAWAAERKDVLSGLLFVLTLAAYAAYARRPFSPWRYAAVVGLFGLGLLAKPMLVTLPAVLLLVDYWPGSRGQGAGTKWDTRIVLDKIPLFAMAAASCAMTVFAQGSALKSGDRVPLTARWANTPVAYVTYLADFFWPRGLAVYYPHHGDSLSPWTVAGATLLLAAISIVAVARWSKWPWLAVGWFWYLGMLVPVIGIVQVGNQARADRYTYLPQIGIAIALAWGLSQFSSWGLSQFSPQRKWDCPLSLHRALCGIVAALLLAALATAAWQQTSYWHDRERLWHRVLDCTTRNPVAHNNLAVGLLLQGRLDEAGEHCRQAIAIKPDYAEAHNNLAVTLANRGRMAEALAECRAAAAIKPDYAEAISNTGNCLMALGRMEEALAEYRRALALQPDHAKAHNNLAAALANSGRLDEAIAEYEQAIQCDRQAPAYHANLATILRRRGRIEEAIQQYRIAIALDEPHSGNIRTSLGIALYQEGRVSEAVTEWLAALRFDPRNVDLLCQVAWVRATDPEPAIRNGPQAVELAQRAVQLSGGQSLVPLNTLAAALAEAGRFAEAIQVTQQALALPAIQPRPDLAAALREHQRLYQAGQPLRVPRHK